MKTETTKPVERRPRDPLLRAADAALRRAARSAQARAREAAVACKRAPARGGCGR